MSDRRPVDRQDSFRRLGYLGSLAAALLASMPVGAQLLVGREASPPDLAGEWRLQNDEDPGQPPLGDYLGIPFNDAGRQRADTTAESIWGTAEYRCRPHSAPHQWRGLGGARILKELDPLTRDVNVYHVQFWRSLDRPIYMDGRERPPAWAPHSWTGFSTGEWVGNTLVVRTTHLKDGFLKRGGPQTSDMYTMTEYLTRNDDYLTVTQIVDDPIYMDEPYVQSTTYWLDPGTTVMMESCVTSALGEGGGTDPHFVPHFLPDQNPYLAEWLEEQNWVPEPATRGGAVTAYPGYVSGSRDAELPVSAPAFDATDRIRAQSPRDGEVHVLPVQGNVYLLVVNGVNIAVSVGPDGALVVNTGESDMAEPLLETIDGLTARVTAHGQPNACAGANCIGRPYGWSSPFMNAVISSPAPARPIRYIVNTSASPEHTGGNELLAAAGFFARRGGTNVLGEGAAASVIAHENVLNALSSPTGEEAPELPPEAWPTDTYFFDFQKLSEYFNSEPIIIYHEPAAITDGDSIVFFRGSEVIAAGDVFSTVSYPRIDIEAGGSIRGVIGALNHILDLAVAEYRSQGGTWIIPGRGRLSDTADVASYRNMLTIVRDRVQDLIDRGLTLDEVIAARPTLDFDGRYGSYSGDWTTADFLEAVYLSLAH